MPLATAAIAAAAVSVPSLMYLNAKHQVGKDLNALLTGVAMQRDVNARRKLPLSPLHGPKLCCPFRPVQLGLLEGTPVKKNRISPWFRFQETVRKYSTAEAIWTPQRSYSFSEVYTRSCQYAAWLLDLGVTPGELVVLYMQNSPDMLCVWLACWSLGSAPAFINYNLSGEALAHTVQVSKAQVIISDADIAHKLDAVQGSLGAEQRIVPLDEAAQAQAFRTTPDAPDAAYAAAVKMTDTALMLYTSGTSGYPKACPMAYSMVCTGMAGRLSSGLCTTPGPNGDRWYNCMPLYHGTGGITSMIAICGGITLCLAKKFSVTNFWKEIRQSRATLFVYVGETARYLLGAPPSPLDRAHNVKVIWGNGMRPDVWTAFQERFGIECICEFFGASEGVLGLQNQARGPFLATAVGYEGGLMRFLLRKKYFTAALDPETGEPFRDPTTGLIVEAPLSVGGELMVQLENESQFSGYYGNPEATEKRLARDVRRKGDVFYRTGDALRRDEDGRWFFMDRLGDTFRWKSENVSTSEVSAVVGALPGIPEAVVYGVLVPRHDGRAGCARLYAPNGPSSLDYASLLQSLQKSLPKYAVPLFLRVSSKPAETTGNNKFIKTALQKEGVNPELVDKADTLMWAPPGAQKYVEFTQADYARLEAGQARL
ncbi:hypothetical protein N7468_004482 [Penicillium chermesinum]|uniref:AMP-dependent synthetase/ligase domain-containing protein n=1 Tax=Penicillium chermesinum TaxID=63820 RepID=A0A9W9PAY6_9EURO|nr:uncharacterized protein N7468_004482 [Penicillium chermesinum]KAJ5239863.1 hypothetical protein N7468_004482 [Penicillium chermesinum]